MIRFLFLAGLAAGFLHAQPDMAAAQAQGSQPEVSEAEEARLEKERRKSVRELPLFDLPSTDGVVRTMVWAETVNALPGRCILPAGDLPALDAKLEEIVCTDFYHEMVNIGSTAVLEPDFSIDMNALRLALISRTPPSLMIAGKVVEISKGMGVMTGQMLRIDVDRIEPGERVRVIVRTEEVSTLDTVRTSYRTGCFRIEDPDSSVAMDGNEQMFCER